MDTSSVGFDRRLYTLDVVGDIDGSEKLNLRRQWTSISVQIDLDRVKDLSGFFATGLWESLIFSYNTLKQHEIKLLGAML